MPTHDEYEQFMREYRVLPPAQRRRFRLAVRDMVEDLKAGRPFRASLRVKSVQKERNVYEMTWAPDGRATFHYGAEQVAGEPHIVWRRIGDHRILDRP